jgi:hypothetical protein
MGFDRRKTKKRDHRHTSHHNPAQASFDSWVLAPGERSSSCYLLVMRFMVAIMTTRAEWRSC